MTLYMIGIGLNSKEDITIKGLEAVKKCSKVYLEHYTSILSCSTEELKGFYGKEITIADRNMVESNAEILLDEAEKDDIAFLVVGDIFGATTHTDLMLRAKKRGIEVIAINNASIMTAIGITGLELYRFGKTTSIVFPDNDWMPHSPYDAIKENLASNLHTLALLDIKVAEPSLEDLRKGINRPQPPRFMTLSQAIDVLLAIEKERNEGIFTEDTLVIGCARIGSESPLIIAGKASEVMKKDFGSPLHSLIIPGNLHHIEQEALDFYK